MLASTDVSGPGTAEDLDSAKQLGHFARMEGRSDFFRPSETRSLLSTPPRARVQQELTWPSALVALVGEVIIPEEDGQGWGHICW